jgi:hypothetical protein
MSKKEEQKNKKLSFKYSSHVGNLLNLEPGTDEFRKEWEKADRAKTRFFHFVKKSLKTKKPQTHQV